MALCEEHSRLVMKRAEGCETCEREAKAKAYDALKEQWDKIVEAISWADAQISD